MSNPRKNNCPQGHRNGSGHQKTRRSNRKPRYTIPVDERKKKPVMHEKPHAEELVCLLLLKSPQGQIAFPNIRTKLEDIQFVDKNKLDHGFSYNRFPARLHVGCGGSPFDEHVVDPKNSCAATLLAGHLGIKNHPWWEKTIRDVCEEDRSGSRVMGNIPYMIKLLYISHGGTPEGDFEVMRWGLTALGAEIESSRRAWNKMKGDVDRKDLRRKWNERQEKLGPLTFKTAKILLAQQNEPDLDWFVRLGKGTLDALEARRLEARETFLDKATCYLVDKPGDGTIRLFTIESNNPEMFTVARNMFKGDIVVIRMRTGHTAILMRYGQEFNLLGVHDELERIETNPAAEWICPRYATGDATKVLNGSTRFLGVSPTGLTLEEIAGAIRRILGEQGSVSVGTAFDVFEEQFGKINV